MVGNSKILTVSYGTFSCTLEGFDDSFDTMKAIAEYFRDLASDDRYFGAEPPQPDAEMLAKIAERELARGVTARADGNAVLLQPAQQANRDDVESDTAAPTKQQPTALTQPADPVQPADTTVAKEASKAQVKEPEPAPEPAARVEEDTTAQDPVVNAAVENTSEPDATVVADRDTQDDTDGAAETLDLKNTVVDAQPDSIAAKLARIQAVVGGAGAGKGNLPLPYSEDEHADEMAAAQDTAQKEDIVDAQAAQEAEVKQAARRKAKAKARAKAKKKAAKEDAAAQAEAEAKAQEQAEQKAADDARKENLRRMQEHLDAERRDAERGEADRLEAKKAAQKQAEQEQAKTAAKAASAAATAAAVAAATGAALKNNGDDTPEDADAQVDADSQAPRARVLKMKRADFEAAVARGQLQVALKADDLSEAESAALAAVEEADIEDDLENGLFENIAERDGLNELDQTEFDGAAIASLSDEDEEDLMRELAIAEEVAAKEISQNASETDAPGTKTHSEPVADTSAQPAIGAKAPVDPASLTDGRAVLDRDAPQDAAIDRILEQTNAQMDAPENKTRRDAFNHLKAAVAATEAARQLGDTKRADDGSDKPYKEDLAQVVRPRRTETPKRRKTDRPTPPPLKLVASQRVDTPAAPAETPKASAGVMPRRIATTPAQAAEDNVGFSRFADSVAATELAELVEAAASYTSDVEGKEVFSRPQVMRKVAAVKGDEYRREDGLRAFGTLMRAGKIEKIKGGQFRVTNTTAFRAEARAAI